MLARTALLLAAAALLVATSAAAEDKVVNVYNWSDYIDDDVLADFTKETGIKVVYDVYDNNEIARDQAARRQLRLRRRRADQPEPGARRSRPARCRSSTSRSCPTSSTMWQFIIRAPGRLRSRQQVRRRLHVGHHRHRLQRRQDQGASCPTRRSIPGRMVFDPQDRLEVRRLRHPFARFARRHDPDRRSPISASTRIPRTRPTSRRPASCSKAVAPYIQKFHSSEYINALANGDICLAIGYSGDVLPGARPRRRGRERRQRRLLDPQGGRADVVRLDGRSPRTRRIPTRRYAFINYMMRPEGRRARTPTTSTTPTATSIRSSMLNEDVIGDPAIYPPQDDARQAVHHHAAGPERRSAS